MSSIGRYLIGRLHELGVRHVFGVPGDYVLQLYKMLEASPIEVVGTTREDCAAFAADAYARMNGLGAVCVTYCVGGLNVCNPIAGAYAEKSPVVVISGAPGVNERIDKPLLHHKVRDFSTQREVFDRLTAATAELDDPVTACREIDRVLDVATRYKRPVYIELPRDRVSAEVDVPHRHDDETTRVDREALAEALDEATKMIERSECPVILAGVEIHRFGLQNELLAFAERSQIPVASTLLGKSVISERHPLHIGVYAAAMGRDGVRKRVEKSDCLVMLGAFLTDIDLGVSSPAFDTNNCIHATSEQLRVRFHHFHEVPFTDFVKGLAQAPMTRRHFEGDGHAERESRVWAANPSAPITVKRLFESLAAFLRDDMVVIADIGDSLIGAIDLVIPRQTEFLSPAYYTSMGFAVPAALGAGLASPLLRPVVIVGDGAFQMTGMELSTIVKHGLNPIVMVLNNEGYGTERLMLEGEFNEIHNWQYHKIPDVLGAGIGWDIRTEGELEAALRAEANEGNSLCLLNIHLSKQDRSLALERLTKRLGTKV